MKTKSMKYLKYLDILRIIACISVLLFHLGLIKGGYLAVCLFFTISAYLSTAKNFRNEHFNIFKYYINKFINIYLPVVFVLLITVFVSKFFSEIAWLNLKLEVKSVLLNYNNYWQISTNVDYFTKSINSPLTHLWYISMFIQYEAIFPFIFLLFRGIGKKISKWLSVILLTLISIGLTVLFVYLTIEKGIMISYYDSLARLYSYMYGITLGFIHCFLGIPILKVFRKNLLLGFMYLLLVGVLITMFIMVSSASNYYMIGMILTSIITLRLIDYSVIINTKFMENIVQLIASISYEIYLIQYPVIYYVVASKLPHITITIITISVVLSIILNFVFSRHLKNIFLKIIRIILLLGIIVLSALGARIFILESDNVEEMKQLEELLQQNEALINNMSSEQMMKQQAEEDEWNATLDSLNAEEGSLEEYVSNMRITGIGDSVMLGAVNGLYKRFPNGYFDGKVSRTDCDAISLINSIDSRGKLYDIVIFNLGTNGSCTKNVPKIIDRLSDKKIYWLTVVNDYQVPNVAKKIYEFPNLYSNVSLIDWKNISAGHTEYFYKDGIHLTSSGIKGYVDAIFNKLLEDKKSEYEVKKQELLKQREEVLNKRITFIGNSALISVYSSLTEELDNTNIIANKDYDYDSLFKDIKDNIENGTINKRVVIVLDNTFKVSKSKLEEVFELLKDYEIIFISFSSTFDHIDSVNMIKFHEYLNDSSMLYVDRVHLSEKGVNKLKEVLLETLKE